MEDSMLMKSPYQLVLVVTCYLIILKIGPILMKHRQPFNLTKILVYYNYSQIIFNIYLLFAGLPIAHKLSLICQPDSNNASESITMSKIHYLYVLLKFYDLLDTVFFVLRKKQEQISFLHVYHHVMIFSVGWMLFKYFPTTHYPGGPLLNFLFINCFVHAVMYTYYLKSTESKMKNVSWKKYVTVLQIVQHYFIFFLCLNAFVNASDCPYPAEILLSGVVGFFSMAYLFTQFYYRAYVRKKEQPQMAANSKPRGD